MSFLPAPCPCWVTPGKSCSRRGRGKRCACGDSDVVPESEKVVSTWGSGGLGSQPALQYDPSVCSEQLWSLSLPQCVRIDETNFSVGFCCQEEGDPGCPRGMRLLPCTVTRPSSTLRLSLSHPFRGTPCAVATQAAPEPVLLLGGTEQGVRLCIC